MARLITAFFEAEHEALGQLLGRCLLPGGEVDLQGFDALRARLLQRIAMEERVLYPALERRLGRPLLERKARAKDHAAFVALCAPRPHREWVEGLWDQLQFHHAAELGPHGFCLEGDALFGPSARALLAEALALPPLVLPPLEEGRGVRRGLTQLLTATGLTRVSF